MSVPQLWLENEIGLFRLWRTQSIPAVFKVATTLGICSSASSNAAFNADTAISRPLTLKGPTSTRVTIRFLTFPVTGLQSCVFSPGAPNICNIVCSEAELRFLLKVSLGGIATTSSGLVSSGLGEDAVKLVFFDAAAFLAIAASPGA